MLLSYCCELNFHVLDLARIANVRLPAHDAGHPLARLLNSTLLDDQTT